MPDPFEAELLFVVDAFAVKLFAVGKFSLGFHSGDLAVLGDFNFGGADLLASLFQSGCDLVAGDELKGDGIGAAGQTAAGDRSVFVVIFGGKAVGDGFTVCSDTSKVYFAPPPSATIVRVRLLGAGPGSNLDFATLSFQVPRKGLVCANKGPAATADKTTIDITSGKHFIRFSPWTLRQSFWRELAVGGLCTHSG